MTRNRQLPAHRLRLLAVVFFLLVMAANLGRYLVFDGLYLWDAQLRWKECAYLLHGLDPFDVMRGSVSPIEAIGSIDASLGGTVPWAYVLGNLINPGFLPREGMYLYLLTLDFLAPLVTSFFMVRFLLRGGYAEDRRTAVLASLLVFAPSMWANAILFGNQSGIVCCCIMLSMCLIENHENIAGLLLALAMCKPQVAFPFFFPLLCRKRWKALGTASVTVAAAWLAASVLAGKDPITMMLEMLYQGLGYTSSYYGLFSWMLQFGVSTSWVLVLDMAAGLVILHAAAKWIFRSHLEDNWLLWYSVAAVVSVLWFYKQGHDYIILALPAIAIFCLHKIPLTAWASILILLVDVIAFGVPKLCTLFFGLSKETVYPWAKLAETLAIIASLYYVFRAARERNALAAA